MGSDRLPGSGGRMLFVGSGAPVASPVGLQDGFFEVYWRRPQAFPDEEVRRGISVWTAVPKDAEQERCAVSALTSHPAIGPNATTICWSSTPPTSAFAWSSPEAGTVQ